MNEQYTDQVFGELGELLRDYRTKFGDGGDSYTKRQKIGDTRMEIWDEVEGRIYNHPKESHKKILEFRKRFGLDQ